MTKRTITAPVLENRPVADNVYHLRLLTPEFTAKPGQFLMMRVGDHALRRPLAIASIDADTMSVYYKRVGSGTTLLSHLRPGASVDLLGPLGTSFTLGARKPLLVAGGMGLAPLLFLAKQYEGRADLLIGLRKKGDSWNAYCPGRSYLTTEDGSAGTCGFPTDLLPALLSGGYDYVAACGPEPMLRKVYEIVKPSNLPCQVSLERRMGCGLGACLSCSVDTTRGRKRVCAEGPVFWAKEVF